MPDSIPPLEQVLAVVDADQEADDSPENQELLAVLAQLDEDIAAAQTKE